MSSTTDSVHGRTLRPLMPRPSLNNTFSSLIGNNHFPSLHNPKLNSWTHPTLCDYGGKMRGAAPPLVSSRWNPTAEQVQALEEMYRRGTRTPSAEQIQQIAAKLRRFGRIEGKNVFYWFQNHKARDRQKKRRQLELDLLAAKNHIPLPKQSGLCRKYLEMEQHPKKLPTMLKCSTGSKYEGGEVEECKRERWTSTSSSSCNLSMHKVIDEKASAQENAFALNLCRPLPSKNDDFEGGVEENRTLELFPLMGSGVSTLSSTKEETDDVSSAGNKLVPNQFFEFLPTKN